MSEYIYHHQYVCTRRARPYILLTIIIIIISIELVGRKEKKQRQDKVQKKFFDCQHRQKSKLVHEGPRKRKTPKINSNTF